MPKARKPGTWSYRSKDETLPAIIGHRGDCIAGNLTRDAVDLRRLIGKVEFRQRNRRTAEAVCLDDIGTRIEINPVNAGDKIRTRQVQDFRAVFRTTIIRVDIQVCGLGVTAHTAITEEDALAQRRQ